MTPILKQVGQSPSSLLRVGLNPNERHTNLPATSLNHVRYKNNKTIDVIKIKTPVRDSGSLYKVNNNNNRNNKMNKTSKEKKAIAIGMRITTSVPRSLFRITRLCRVMAINDPKGRNFYSPRTSMMDYFSCTPLDSQTLILSVAFALKHESVAVRHNVLTSKCCNDVN